MTDILIKNGQVIDGSGVVGKFADVAIRGDQIIDIGSLEGVKADQVIDAAGKIVSPGFIDMHSHHDMACLVNREADSLVQQGITTVVSGQCGISPAPLSDETRDQVLQMMADDEFPIPWDRINSFASFLDMIEEFGTSVNIHQIVGQGMVRSAVMGYRADRPNEDQIEQMQNIVSKAMDEGAIGISTGLIYPPGSYASIDELIEVTKPVGERGGIYFSHIRGEGDSLIDAIEEEIEIGRKTGAAIHHSHYKAAGQENWDQAILGLELIDNARSEGVSMTADMYPYLAGGTGLMAILPEWAQEGGFEDVAKRLTDPEVRRKMTDSMKNEGFFKIADWTKVLIPGSANPAYIGKYIAELADEAGKTPYDWIFDALSETKGQTSMILFMMSEENVKMQLPHPCMMIGTDGVGMPFEGPRAKGAPHPRSFGTYPKVLGKYVREEKVLTLEDAIRRMTGYPAETLGYSDRGFIRKGYKADLVIFDPETIIDKADYVNPFQKPAGIDYVLVNGRVVVNGGIHSHELPGVVISR
ncbi:MAG: D-aminoacylase [Anaerolineaceae bacterium]|nr:D-aminoacylase [Anaerolineaceae bacterium]